MDGDWWDGNEMQFSIECMETRARPNTDPTDPLRMAIPIILRFREYGIKGSGSKCSSLIQNL